MNDHTQIDDDGDAWLAELVADLAERVARGETPDVGNLETLDSRTARAIERLLPAIRFLSEPDQDRETRGQLPRDARPPNVLGDFQIGDEIGRGGIGVVYNAVQISLSRRVAVKVLPPAALLDPRQMRRFEIEAQAAAALQHPSIVPVFAYGSEGGLPYFAMRLIEGRNLAEVVAERRERQYGGLAPQEVAELGRQAADALDYAHRNDVLHRDIKPSNLLIDQHQHLWVADFGLARIRSDSDLTASGDVLGTLRYLSPEQASGKRGIVDGRTDIYGLGATLFELLTLRPVYEGDDRAELLIKIVADEPRFSRRGDAAVPTDLKTIVLKALAKDPIDRYPTASELADDLRRFLAGEPIRARPATSLERTWRWCRRNRLVAASLSAVAASMLVATVVSTSFGLRAEHARQAEAELARSETKARQDAVAARRDVQQQLIDLSAQSGLTAAREGDHALALLWFSRAVQLAGDHPDREELNRVRYANWLRHVWTPEGTFALPGFRQDRHQFRELRFSPDGKYLLATARGGDRTVWDRRAGRLVALSGPVPGGSAAAWEPTTGALAVGGNDGKVRLLAPPAFDPEGELAADAEILTLAFSRDGRYLAWGGPRGARVWDREKKDHSTPFLPHAGPVATLAFSMDGTLLATSARDMKARVFRVPSTTPDPLFPPVPHVLAEYGINHGGPDRVAPRFAAGDTTLLTVGKHETAYFLHWRSATTGESLAMTKAPSRDFLGAFDVSPSGEQVAATWDSNGLLWDAQRRLVLASFRAGEFTWCEDLTFSADGKLLIGGGHDMAVQAFSLEKQHDFNLMRASPPIAQSRQVVRVALTRDSKHLAVALWDGTVRLWRCPDGPPIAYRIPSGGPTWLTLSPDKRLVMPRGTSFRSGALRETRVCDSATGNPVGLKIDPGGIIVDAQFSPDGTQVALAALTASTPDERAQRIFLGNGEAGNVQLWDWRTGRRGFGPIPMPAEPRGLAYSPTGNCLAAVCADYRVVLIDPTTGTVHHQLDPGIRTRPYDANLWTTNGAAVFNPDGRFLFTWELVPTTHVWDPASGRLIHTLDHTDRIENATFNPRSPHILATGGRNSTVTLWDLETGKRLIELPHPAWVQTLAFTTDGTELISGCSDGLIRVWNWRTGELRRGLPHDRSLLNYAFTKKRDWLAVLGNPSLELTHWRSGQPASPSWDLGSGLHWSVAVPDGDRRAIVSGFENMITGCDLETMTTPAPATADHLNRLAEIVSGRRITNEGNVVPISGAEWTERWDRLGRTVNVLAEKPIATAPPRP